MALSLFMSYVLRSRKPTAEKSATENPRRKRLILVMENISCRKYGIQSTNEMVFIRTVTLRASFWFPAIACARQMPPCSFKYRKIPKISPCAYIFQRPFLRGLFLKGLIYGGKFAFQIDWASLIVGSKFTSPRRGAGIFKQMWVKMFYVKERCC